MKGRFDLLIPQPVDPIPTSLGRLRSSSVLHVGSGLGQAVPEREREGEEEDDQKGDPHGIAQKGPHGLQRLFGKPVEAGVDERQESLPGRVLRGRETPVSHHPGRGRGGRASRRGRTRLRRGGPERRCGPDLRLASCRDSTTSWVSPATPAASIGLRARHRITVPVFLSQPRMGDSIKPGAKAPGTRNPQRLPSPERATADRRGKRCCRPFRAFGCVVHSLPGAHAPGFMLSPILG